MIALCEKKNVENDVVMKEKKNVKNLQNIAE